MPKITLDDVPETSGTDYPSCFASPCLERRKKAVGDFGGLTQFGAHIITLPPGAWSSQRHWHSAEDEMVMILDGHPTLIDNDGETTLKPRDMTIHPAGEANGHHMINRTDKDVSFIIIGRRNPKNDHAHYPDIDLDLPANGSPDRVYQRKNGMLY